MPRAEFMTGDEVRVVHGPFAGMFGMVVEEVHKGTNPMYIVQTKNLGRIVHIKVEQTDLETPYFYHRPDFLSQIIPNAPRLNRERRVDADY